MGFFATDTLRHTMPAGSRRAVLRALLGAAVVAATDLGSASGKSKNKQRKLKRCKRDARKCRNEASAYCTANYPDQPTVCTSEITRCCNFLRTCRYPKTNSCSASVIW